MPTFGATSKRRLETCDERLQTICWLVIPHFDFTVLCGHRTEEAQRRVYRLGRSKVQWPNSMHNRQPSLAVDLAPWPIDWHNLERFHYMAGRILQAAVAEGVPLRWGGHFQSFFDGPHFEIVEG